MSDEHSLDDQPICAVASGNGGAAICLIRLSGRHCHDLLARCLTPRGKGAWPDREVRLCRLEDLGETIDEPMAVRFGAPRSYTGQDMAEIYCHGGPYIVQRVLTALYRVGFRAAEAGEFTRRAYLSGKLDLTAAEGIRGMVEAESHQQWVAARQLMDGKLRGLVEDLRTRLLEAMAYLEARIDFPDEGDVAGVELAEARERVARVSTAIDQLKASYANGRVASRGLMVALFGAPNAGKSTLMNTLLGRERAIVTATPGTTRDYLEEACLVHGRLVRLVDMAGVRDAPDEVERLGVATALRLASEADIVLCLAGADSPEQAKAVDDWLQKVTPRHVLRLLTKADLAAGIPPWAKGYLALSCKSGVGVESLKESLAAAVDRHVGGLEEGAFITTARHKDALEKARQALDEFTRADVSGQFEECLAFELQNAARALATIVGEIGSDDVLGEVFSQFCIGK